MAFIALLLLMAPATPADAHAELVTSTPEPGVGVPQAPGAVVLKFTEPLNARLSSITLTGGGERDVSRQPTEPVAGDPAAIKMPLGLLPPGVYTVHWVTVSSVDGHTLRGSYEFGIGTASLANDHVASSPLASEGWLGLVGHFLGLVGLVMWAGFALLRRAAERAGVSHARLSAIGRLAPGLSLLGVGLGAASAALVSTGSLGAVDDVLTSGGSGRLQLVLLVCSAGGLMLATFTPRSSLSGLFALGALVSEAASGHAAASSLPAVAIASFTVHLGAVGVWMFAIVGTVLSSRRLRDALRTLTPYAVGAAVVVAVTGLANATIEIGGLRDLTGTGYGRIVIAKGAALLAMAALGLTHYRRRAGRSERLNRLRSPLRWELTAGLVTVALATLLVGFPNPPGEAEAEAPSTGIDPVLTHLSHRDALSVAGASGPFVVGLTLLPPMPGPVGVRVQVLGTQAGDALRVARLRATSATGSTLHVRLRACGLGCFAGRGNFDQAGTWRLSTSITSNRGPIHTAVAVRLPAENGSPILSRAVRSMEQLHSARMKENLRGDVNGPDIKSRYLFRAPSAFEVESGRTRRIVIGGKSFQRTAPTKPWKAAPSGFDFTWPHNYYRTFWGRPVAVRFLGRQRVDGVRRDVISFFRPDLPAWFRLWVGHSSGLVYREEMRAEAHIMDHAYGGFDRRVPIRNPLRTRRGNA